MLGRAPNYVRRRVQSPVLELHEARLRRRIRRACHRFETAIPEMDALAGACVAAFGG